MPVRQIISSPHFAFVTPEKFIHAIPSLAFWGAGTAAALSLFGSDVPLVKKDILSNIPIVGGQWDVELPAEEKSK
ncbi:cytochrome b-c1 complex subunit 10 [Absidia repens]|uniref:Cytochrome b-c1 complex subunit 10 n=1 Tax=Absidia repens TaxID=90262 RepID=A0A1X2IND8_9FUNG|nr:cytochrome b-c1 complex subunit 10 [Absidia repens]